MGLVLAAYIYILAHDCNRWIHWIEIVTHSHSLIVFMATRRLSLRQNLLELWTSLIKAYCHNDYGQEWTYFRVKILTFHGTPMDMIVRNNSYIHVLGKWDRNGVPIEGYTQITQYAEHFLISVQSWGRILCSHNRQDTFLSQWSSEERVQYSHTLQDTSSYQQNTKARVLCSHGGEVVVGWLQEHSSL